tara:strand:- start:1209 stop:1490 length:282 start_codon:yes stop_codon:yes gene_type:complete
MEEVNEIKVVKNEAEEYFKVENEDLYYKYDNPEWGLVELFEGWTKGDIKELETLLGKFNYEQEHLEDSWDITETFVVASELESSTKWGESDVN